MLARPAGGCNFHRAGKLLSYFSRMSSSSESAFDQAWTDESYAHEAQSEKLSNFLLAAAVVAIYAIFAFGGKERKTELFRDISWLVAVAVPLFLIAASYTHFFGYRRWMKYASLVVQVTAVSWAIHLDAKNQGAVYAMSSVPPLIYGVVIAVTAFRLSPKLCLFAGGLVALEYLALYNFVLLPRLTHETLRSLPSLKWDVTAMKAVMYLAIGVACALAAQSLKKSLRRNIEAASRNVVLERTFGRYVSPQIAREILSNEDAMAPRMAEAVVMFADLKGFTQFASRKTPAETAALLNRCWEQAIEIIESSGGVINKFLGDGFLALFGVPLAMPEAERVAARCAMALQVRLAPILEVEGLELCVGLHKGPVIAGGVGSESRSEFTVIGTTVNAASRIESLNRSLGTRCLASGQIAVALGDEFRLENKGEQALRGLSEPLQIFEVRPAKPVA